MGLVLAIDTWDCKAMRLTCNAPSIYQWINEVRQVRRSGTNGRGNWPLSEGLPERLHATIGQRNKEFFH